MELFYSQLTIMAFLLTIGAFWLTLLAFCLQLELFAYNGKVRLISALRDCKQRSLTVSQKATTVSIKHSPVFVGYRTIIARYVAKWDIAQMCLCETKHQGGGIAPFWGSVNLPEKVLRNMGYRSDSIAVSRDMGPLSIPKWP